MNKVTKGYILAWVQAILSSLVVVFFNIVIDLPWIVLPIIIIISVFAANILTNISKEEK